jgi:hypothetical protein
MTMTFLRLFYLAAVAFHSLQPYSFSGLKEARLAADTLRSAARFAEHAFIAVQQTFDDAFDLGFLSSPLLVNATYLDPVTLNITPDRHEHVRLNSSPSLDDEDRAMAPSVSSFSKVVERAVDQLSDKITTIFGLVYRVINLISSSITEFIDSVVATVETTIINIIDSALSVVSLVSNSVKDMIDSVLSTFSTMIEDTVDAVVLSFKNFVIALLDFMLYWTIRGIWTSVAVFVVLLTFAPTTLKCYLNQEPIVRPVLRPVTRPAARPVARPAARPAQAPILHQGLPNLPLSVDENLFPHFAQALRVALAAAIAEGRASAAAAAA